MARGFVIRRRLRRSPEAVWDLLVDPGRAWEWQGGVPAPGDGAPPPVPGIGRVYSARPTGAGAPPREMVVTQWQPKRRYGVSCRLGRLNATFLYTLRGQARGTDMELRLVLMADGRWWPVHSLAAIALYGRQVLHLHRFKRAVEG